MKGKGEAKEAGHYAVVWREREKSVTEKETESEREREKKAASGTSREFRDRRAVCRMLGEEMEYGGVGWIARGIALEEEGRRPR